MKTILSAASSLLVSLLLFTACTRGPLLEEFKSIPDANWIRFQTLWFDYPADEKTDPCTLSLIVRYTDEVPFTVLHIMGTIHTPSGEMRYREYHVPLKDREGNVDGALLEEPDQALKVYEKEISLRKDFVFSEDGKYKIEIENLMTKYDNPGIVSIGLRILRAE